MTEDTAGSSDVLARFELDTEEFVLLLRKLEPADAQRPVDGSAWTVAQTAAHVCSLFRRMTEDARRSAGHDDLAALNDVGVEEVGEDLGSIADEIETRGQLIVGTVPLVPADRRFPFHAGQEVTVAAALAIVNGELKIHGAEVAEAVGASWRIEPEDLLPVWRYASPALQGWLRPEAADVSEIWSLRFPENDRPVIVRIDRGQLDIDPDPTPEADHVVEVDDTVAFTLAFPYGRGELTNRAARRLAALFHPF